MKIGLASGTTPLALCSTCVPSYTRLKPYNPKGTCSKCGSIGQTFIMVSNHKG